MYCVFLHFNRIGMQRPPWGRRGLKLQQERKMRRRKIKEKVERRVRKRKNECHGFFFILSEHSEFICDNCP